MHRYKLIFISSFSLIIASTLFFLIPEINSKKEFYREFSKSLLTLDAIFLAFYPAFYTFIYSSNEIRRTLVRIGVKHLFDDYFRKSVTATGLLLIITLGSIPTFYLEVNGTIFTIVCKVIFATLCGIFTYATFWTYFYGNLAYLSITKLIKDSNSSTTP
jgi:hypothetical protein